MKKVDSIKKGQPYRATEAIWTTESAPLWALRTYLNQTICGLIQSILSATDEFKNVQGIAHIPRRHLDTLNWWPEENEQPESDLISIHPGRNWHSIPQPFSRRTGIGKDIWIIWFCEKGAVSLIAKRNSPRKTAGMLKMETWDVRLTWSPDNIRQTLRVFRHLWQDFESLSLLSKSYEEELTGYAPSDGNSSLSAIIRSALTLADHVDPWTRHQLTETAWITLFNKIQNHVVWELEINSLMAAIGNILNETIGYDLFEISIFSGVGKRHEEFISWRRNLTGFGDDNLSLLLDERLVKDLMSSQLPMLINTTRTDGLLNPHLAQLALLREGLLIPLAHGKEIKGLISLYFRQPTNLQQVELSKLSQISKVIARSIENTNAHENVRRMATTDALTGLYNRRTFDDQIRKEMRRAQRYNQHFSLIMIDIDHFKNYNDTNGHLSGDHLLQRFSSILKTSVRDQDIVARYGGEEFAVVLPHTDADNGIVVAEKIRTRVLEAAFPYEERQPSGQLTISLGIADTHSLERLTSPQELISIADKALYHAKETGRNQSVLYTSDIAS